jgi:hypothetical protein
MLARGLALLGAFGLAAPDLARITANSPAPSMPARWRAGISRPVWGAANEATLLDSCLLSLAQQAFGF